MTDKRSLAFRILLVVAVIGGLALVVCLSSALSELAGGPTQGGYELLAIAIGCLPYLAAVVVLTAIIGSIGARVRFAVGGLALSSGVVGGVAAGLVAMGSTLASIEPRRQPIELNSLLLAVWGVGTQIAPAALVLFVGAAILGAGTAVAHRVRITSAKVPVNAI